VAIKITLHHFLATLLAIAACVQNSHAGVSEQVRLALNDLTRIVPGTWSPAEAAHLKAANSSPDLAYVHHKTFSRVALQLNGSNWIDSSISDLHEIAIEHFQLGPPRLVLRAQAGNWHTQRPARQGALLVANLVDAEGGELEIFRGRIVSGPSSVPESTPVLVTALQTELKRGADTTKRVFLNMRLSEAVTNLLNEAGLQTRNESTLSEPVLARITQDRALWPYLVNIAERGQYLFAMSGNTLRMTYLGPPRRTSDIVWENMKLSEIVAEIASRNGFQHSIKIKHSEKTLTKVVQREEDALFLFRLARGVGDSFFIDRDTYHLRDDPALSPLSPEIKTKRHGQLNLEDFIRGLGNRCRMRAQLPGTNKLLLDGIVQTQETDLGFAQRVARILKHTLTTSGGMLRLDANTRVPGHAGDHLDTRLVIRPGKRPTLSVGHASLCSQLADPLRVATTRYELTVPRRGPAPPDTSATAGLPGNLAPAATELAKTLTLANDTLARQGGDPVLGFRMHRTDYYLPSLAHYYALLPDGSTRLAKIRQLLQQ
jgi:hypothetical protein